MDKSSCKILVTGSRGFLGKNLCTALVDRGYGNVCEFDRESSMDELREALKDCRYIFHLAGVNRPLDRKEFYHSNGDLTETICRTLIDEKNYPTIILASSTQACLNNDYGKSKKIAEDTLFLYSQTTGAPVYVFRFPGVFGKWCKPNYNSVVATFCHQIARDGSIRIDAPTKEIELLYIDDVCDMFCGILERSYPIMNKGFCRVSPTTKISLEDLANTIKEFHVQRSAGILPDISSDFNKKLYSTYLSYLPVENLSVRPVVKSDERGSFAELFKTEHVGQVSMCRVNPGSTRGNHRHNTKTEKFAVIGGSGCLRLRDAYGSGVCEIPIDGANPEIVDIPPGVTHSIVNTGDDILITLIWANELFNEDKPDTIFDEV